MAAHASPAMKNLESLSLKLSSRQGERFHNFYPKISQPSLSDLVFKVPKITSLTCNYCNFDLY